MTTSKPFAGAMFCRVTAALLLLGTTAHAERGRVAKLAAKLASLRGEVESLSSELSGQKQKLARQLRSLGAQQGELDAVINRERLRLEQLQARVAKRRREVDQRGDKLRALRPVVVAAAAALAASIDSGLPFKRDERRRAVVEIVERMQAKVVAPDVALARLWTRLSDELRLTRESGLYRQQLELDGQKQLVDVARIGMVLLYFRTSNGRYGMAQRRDTSWRFVLLSSPAHRRQIAQLFDALKKRIRSGLFSLPNGLPPAAKKEL